MFDWKHTWHQSAKVCKFLDLLYLSILGCQNDDDFRTKNTSPKQSLKASFVSFMIGDRCCFMDVFLGTKSILSIKFIVSLFETQGNVCPMRAYHRVCAFASTIPEVECTDFPRVACPGRHMRRRLPPRGVPLPGTGEGAFFPTELHTQK